MENITWLHRKFRPSFSSTFTDKKRENGLRFDGVITMSLVAALNWN